MILKSYHKFPINVILKLFIINKKKHNTIKCISDFSYVE